MSPEPETSHAQFRALFNEVCTWSRWPERQEFGALNYLTPERVVAAAGMVRDGRAISLGRTLDTEGRADNPSPAEHRMTQLPEAASGVAFAKDYVGVDFHNEGHSHIDALGHVAYDGRLYGGQLADRITSGGAEVASIAMLRDGLTGRGVLLDIPALHDVDRLPDGAQVHRGELEAAASRQDVRIGQGDVLIVRTSARHSGLHPQAVTFLADRQVAALGSDGNSEAAPSRTEGIEFPIHVLAINAMGIHLMDYLQLEPLAAACEGLQRWEFLLTVAPLRIDGGTGSPVNPIAVF